MANPIICMKCRETIGLDHSGEFSRATKFTGEMEVSCKGKHPKPERTESMKLFGLLKRTDVFYRETRTKSSWSEYVGPANSFCLWLAIVLGSKRHAIGGYSGVLVNGKKAYYSMRTGLWGDGVDELHKLTV